MDGCKIYCSSSFVNKKTHVHAVATSELKFTVLSGHPAYMLPSRNSAPYYELPLYRTQGYVDVPKRSLLVDNLGAVQAKYQRK